MYYFVLEILAEQHLELDEGKADHRIGKRMVQVFRRLETQLTR